MSEVKVYVKVEKTPNYYGLGGFKMVRKVLVTKSIEGDSFLSRVAKQVSRDLGKSFKPINKVHNAIGVPSLVVILEGYQLRYTIVNGRVV